LAANVSGTNKNIQNQIFLLFIAIPIAKILPKYKDTQRHSTEAYDLLFPVAVNVVKIDFETYLVTCENLHVPVIAKFPVGLVLAAKRSNAISRFTISLQSSIVSNIPI